MENDTQVIVAESASEDDVMLADWGREQFKSSLGLANDVLKQAVTIISLLLTAALGFLDKVGVGRGWQVTTFVLLLVPLIVSFIGLAPVSIEIDIRDAESVRTFRNAVLRKKRRALFCITWFLAAAFVSALVGILTRPHN